ncbi:MAG: trigger factor, partial [Anaerolineales bacterium]|nr:trigger factor [Anaerolineales bacterium]
VRAEVVNEMLDKVVFEALQQEDIEPYAQPMLDDVEMKPLVLKLLVPLEPVVNLDPSYRELTLAYEVPAVSEEAVDEALEGIRMRQAAVEDVERPAELGDFVKLSGHGALLPVPAEGEDGETNDEPLEHDAPDTIFHDHDGVEFLLDAEKTYPGTSFVDNVVGSSVGDTVIFDIEFPDDYSEADYVGRTARFSVDVLSVQTRELPELDEALAEEEGYESVEDLRTAERERLEAQAEQAARNDFLESMIDQLMTVVEMVYPPSAVTQELDSSVENLKKQVEQYGMTWNNYLQSQGKTVEDLHDLWRDDVVRNLERSLVLGEFIRAERLQIGQEEIDAAVDKRLTQFGTDLDPEMMDSLRQIFAGGDNLRAIANEVMIDKVFERMLLIGAGNPPDLDALEAEMKAQAEAKAAEAEAALAEQDAEVEAEQEEAEDQTDTAEPEAETDADEA